VFDIYLFILLGVDLFLLSYVISWVLLIPDILL
jgi:hypothetical protein